MNGKKNKVLWHKGKFWPGFSWRILAHRRTDTGAAITSSYLEDGQIQLSSKDYEVPVEFDELVIDHWFHLEQMSDRSWWIGLANWHINVEIDGNGVPHVASYQNRSEEEYAAEIERLRLNEPVIIPPRKPIPTLVETK